MDREEAQRVVSVGGDWPINGVGYDINEDGVFDKLEKREPASFTLSDIEKELHRVKELAKHSPDKIYRSKAYGECRK